MANTNEDSIKSIKGFIKTFFICYIISVLSFVVLISNSLTNTYDGMWKGSFYQYYYWVISILRWFWPIIGKARLDMSPEPFTSLLSLLLIVFGNTLVVFCFGNKSNTKRYLIILLSTINTVVCVFLSYRYMSPTFAFSFLFSVLGFCCIIKSNWKRFLLSVLFLTLSLGSYQANIGVMCVLILLWTAKILIYDSSKKKAFAFLGISTGSFLIACIADKIAADIVLTKLGIEAAGYNGANNLSVLNMLKAFPKTFIRTYKYFYDFYFANGIKINAYQSSRIYKIGLIILLVLIVLGIIKSVVLNQKWGINIILVFICLALIPSAANIATIIAAESGYPTIQMTMAMFVSIPWLICLLEDNNIVERITVLLKKNDVNEIGKTKTGIKSYLITLYEVSILALLVLFFIGNFLMVSVDQQVMLDSRGNALALLNRISSEIDWKEASSREFVFIGKPSDNIEFSHDELWNRANGYARYGEFWIGGDCGLQSYEGYVRDAGINIKVLTDSGIWNSVIKKESADMQSYPEEGFIKYTEDGLCIIKISD